MKSIKYNILNEVVNISSLVSVLFIQSWQFKDFPIETMVIFPNFP